MQSNLSNLPFCISASINNNDNKKKAFLTRGSPTQLRQCAPDHGLDEPF